MPEDAGKALVRAASGALKAADPLSEREVFTLVGCVESDLIVRASH